MSLDKLKIGQRIAAGSGVLLLILVIMSGVGTYLLMNISSNFDEYRRIARNSNIVGEVDIGFAKARLAVKDFLVQGDEAQLQRFTEATTEIDGLLKQADANIKHEQRRAWLAEATAAYGKYRDAFTDVVKGYRENNRIMRDVLDKNGPIFEQALDRVVQTAAADNDVRAFQAASTVLQEMTGVRMQMQRLQARRDKDSVQKVEAALGDIDQGLRTLVPAMQNPARRALAVEAVKAAEAYVGGVKQAVAVVEAVQATVNDRLNPSGAQISALTAQIRQSQRAQQDEIGPRIVEEIWESELISVVLAVVGLVIGLVSSWIITRSITLPVKALTGTMTELAAGNLSVTVPMAANQDEIGDMARAVEVFKTNGLERRRLEAEQAAEQEVRDRRTAKLEQLMAGFDSEVQALVSQLSSASTQMRSSAQSLSALSEQTSHQSVSVAGAAEQASANVQAVATATEELSASLEEITRRVAESATVTRHAHEEAERTNVTVATLADAADRIGTVVQLIQDIAGQTNLLALNATIEAARAGEAGKGFAVVASEVKSLANQTAKATEDIAGQVQQVQTATRDAVAAIQSITATIAKVNEISAAIAAAVEEQGAATQEIARNVQQAAMGTQDVSETITSVRAAAGETGTAASEVLSVASGVQSQSDRLTGAVGSFLVNVKAA